MSAPKVGIITRHWDIPVGTGTFARGLVGTLASAGGFELHLYLPGRPVRPVPKGVSVHAAAVPLRRYRLTRWEHFSAPRAAAADGMDLLHYLHPATPYPKVPPPVLTTVHDLIPFVLPDYRLPLPYQRLLKRDIRAADGVVTVSESARKDLKRLFPNRGQVSVIPNAVPPAAKPASRKGGFFLFVGGTERRKGLRDALEALSAIDGDWTLRIAGPTRANPIFDDRGDLLSVLTPAQRKHVKFLGSVSDRELGRLYRTARALVFPSKYEGFGLPPLEAMNAGTPVVGYANSSIPEVTGKAALLVPTGDVPALTAAIRSILTTPALRTRLAAAGIRQARSFTWERSGARAAAVYRQALRRAR